MTCDEDDRINNNETLTLLTKGQLVKLLRSNFSVKYSLSKWEKVEVQFLNDLESVIWYNVVAAKFMTGQYTVASLAKYYKVKKSEISRILALYRLKKSKHGEFECYA
jgi:hypothetical protein